MLSECNLFFIQTFWVLSFHSNSWSKLDLFVRALMCCTIKYSFHTIGSFWKMDKLISYLFNIQNVFLDYIYMYVLTIHILNNPWHFFSRLKWFVWRFELCTFHKFDYYRSNIHPCLESSGSSSHNDRANSFKDFKMCLSKTNLYMFRILTRVLN